MAEITPGEAIMRRMRRKGGAVLYSQCPGEKKIQTNTKINKKMERGGKKWKRGSL